MTRLRHFEHFGTARFVTFSCYRRYRVFDSQNACALMVRHIAKLRHDSSVRLLGCVIMPEYVHLVVWPPPGTRLGVLIGQMKARVAREILRDLRNDTSEVLKKEDRVGKLQIFQRRCYDHNCRTTETVKEKIEYCHKNPVTRGLVKEPHEWTWSSCNWYAGERDVPLAMDELEL